MDARTRRDQNAERFLRLVLTPPMPISQLVLAQSDPALTAEERVERREP